MPSPVARPKKSFAERVRGRLVRELNEIEYQITLKRHASKIPSLSEADRKILDGLVRDGVYQTSLAELQLPLTNEMLDAAKRLEAYIPETPTDQGDIYGNATINHYVEHLDVAQHGAAVYFWGLNQRLLDIAEAYLRVPPALIGVSFRKDKNTGHDLGARVWHQDQEDRHELKIGVYHTEVNEFTPAFEYLPRSIPLSKDGVPFNAHDIHLHIPADQRRICVGPPGTVISFAASDVFHRGRLPNEDRGDERIAAWYAYTSRKSKFQWNIERHFSREALDTLKPQMKPEQLPYVYWL